MRDHGRALVGHTWDGGEFPLLVKVIDASDHLSVQVHPDDAIAQALGKAKRGKTECWRMLADGGELYVGTVAGVDRQHFTASLANGTVASLLKKLPARKGDFFFIPARTVHALGAGCLLIEVQQTCDVTFRVHDWDRLGLDGKPRPLHIEESLAAIDFAAQRPQPEPTVTAPHSDGGEVRHLITCPYFQVFERRGSSIRGGGDDRCSIVSSIAGSGRIRTIGGYADIAATETVLIPAAAGEWSCEGEAHLFISQPGIPGR
jgi:mannose-6-phosphate isomerase